MSASVTWQGLLDLEVDLWNLPKDLAEEAADIVQNAAEISEWQLIRAYPLGPTGNLRNRVTLGVERSAFGIAVTLRSRAPHAHLWDFGTVKRHYTTKTHHRVHNTGRMRSSKERGRDGLVNIVVRNREVMRQQLAAIVERAGFRVSA